VRARILIVEDSQLVTEAFSILFTEAGYDVGSAATVAEGIERAGAEPVDIMLLDLSLPDGDGLEILEALGKQGTLPRVTLAMTGDNDQARRRKCLEAGCADVMLKPVPIGELLRRIKHHLA
jgi:two-component system KDP operon response regulator KdpE